MPIHYLLDTGPLGLLVHARPTRRHPIQAWILEALKAGSSIFISEVADYEVRRELIRLIQAGQMPASRLVRLDELGTLCPYLPVSTSTWRKAAELWAEARLQGRPTADPSALDADVLIAAQASLLQATVVTNNPTHLGRWVPTHHWV